ncbi:MAG: hypothetical protein QOE08_1858 [Thermoleophilaceae bacterium]|jgi:hypothetical protein|nr:hypothetical protein [Thermoleophilaceae bacterium]
MSMPSGDSPKDAQQYYHYLQSHQLVPHGRDATWHVDWTSLAWMWGFVAVLVVIIFVWIRQYRTTRHRFGIFPLDTWAGYTTEAAGPATTYFFVFTLVVVLFGGEMVVGHLLNGQLF